MRILQLHCDYIEFTPVKREIKSAEEIDPQSKRFEEVLVAFIAVEEGDNSDVAKKAMVEISDSMKKIGCNKLLLYPYAHLSSKLASPSTALLLLKEMETQVKNLEIYRAPFGWTKSYKIQVKGHPLAENSKTITASEDKESTSDALKAESKIQSFWHIMTPDGKMHDVGKFDFSRHDNLEVLAKYESVKQRSANESPPHVKLMKKLAIADYEPAICK